VRGKTAAAPIFPEMDADPAKKIQAGSSGGDDAVRQGRRTAAA
jgi:hypothetical protein